MGTSSDRSSGVGGAWTPLKHAATSYAHTIPGGSASRVAARRLLPRYVAVLGGAGAAASSARGGSRSIAGLGGFLAGVGSGGLAPTLQALGLTNLVGRDRFDVLDGLVTLIAGDGSDVESQAARDALCDVLDELYADATSWQDLDDTVMTATAMADLLKMFLTHYIYNRLPVLPERLARSMSPEAARSADAQILGLIADLVEVRMPDDPFGLDWNGAEGRAFADSTLRDAYEIVEAMRPPA